MSQKIKAIVIKSNDKKEKDANILLFSLELGKFWATLKGVKNPKAKMKLANNPFTFGEFILEEGKGGLIITGFDLIENFHEICEDVEKYFEAYAVLEVIEKIDFSTAGERAGVFVLALKTLKNICFGKCKRLYSLDKFYIEFFKIYGFPLYSDKCTCCKSTAFDRLYVDYADGNLVCTACRTFSCEEISKAAYVALKFLNSTDFERLSTLKLAQKSEEELLKILVKNFEYHFDCRLKLMGILS